MGWEKVEGAVLGAHSIAFDGCHKIYLSMDAEQTAEMIDYGYQEDGSQMRFAATDTPEQMLATLHEWFDQSCGLRFINAVRTVEGDPNLGFTDLIAQFEFEDAEEEEEDEES